MRPNRVSSTLKDYDVDQPHGQGIFRLGDALPRVVASYGLSARAENGRAGSGPGVCQDERVRTERRLAGPKGGRSKQYEHHNRHLNSSFSIGGGISS